MFSSNGNGSLFGKLFAGLLLQMFFVAAAYGQYYTGLIKKNGGAAGDKFGWSVAWMGDRNCSGTCIIVGAPFADPRGDTSAGKIYVYGGGDGHLNYSIDGGQVGGLFGFAVGGQGVELEAWYDSFDGWVAGAPMYDTLSASDRGKLYAYTVWSAPYHTWWFHGESATDKFGYSIWGLHYRSGDSADGFVVGSPLYDTSSQNDIGKIYVYWVTDFESQNTHCSLRVAVKGTGANDRFGFSVAGVGDLNGDQREDIAVGAPYHDTSGQSDVGKVYILSGITGDTLFRPIKGTGSGDLFGYSVAPAGDVNNDTTPDFIVGAPFHDTLSNYDVGKVYVFSGKNGSLLYRIRGNVIAGGDEIYGDQFGYSVGGGKDINGDGKPDIIVGAPFHDTLSQEDVGKVYVFSGPNGSLIDRKKGNDAGDQFGSSVAALGDANSDGKSDFVVGAPLGDPGGSTDAGYIIEYVACSKKKGDIDGNGSIAQADVTSLQSCVTGGSCSYNKCFADMDCDGDIDQTDADILSAFVFSGTPLPCP